MTQPKLGGGNVSLTPGHLPSLHWFHDCNLLTKVPVSFFVEDWYPMFFLALLSEETNNVLEFDV